MHASSANDQEPLGIPSFRGKDMFRSLSAEHGRKAGERRRKAGCKSPFENAYW
jgi:hypothetical protein